MNHTDSPIVAPHRATSTCALLHHASHAASGSSARRRRAFTLLEMLIVLFIIGMLAALLVPRLMGQVGGSKVNVAKASISQLAQSVEQFRLDVGRYPTDQEGLAVLVKKPDAAENWKGPYWDKKTLPKDPWQHEFVYRVNSEFGFVIKSFGADGKEGGEGDSADLDNRS